MTKSPPRRGSARVFWKQSKKINGSFCPEGYSIVASFARSRVFWGWMRIAWSPNTLWDGERCARPRRRSAIPSYAAKLASGCSRCCDDRLAYCRWSLRIPSLRLRNRSEAARTFPGGSCRRPNWSFHQPTCDTGCWRCQRIASPGCCAAGKRSSSSRPRSQDAGREASRRESDR